MVSYRLHCCSKDLIANMGVLLDSCVQTLSTDYSEQISLKPG